MAPVNGLLSGEKVKPVLINSKLPLDVLGKVLISVMVPYKCIKEYKSVVFDQTHEVTLKGYVHNLSSVS